VTIQRAKPLPECPGCDRPTLRDVYLAHGGMCSECAELVPTVKMLPVRDGPPPDDRTAFVEGWRPPVPGRRTPDA
jgi:hypothetical protein